MEPRRAARSEIEDRERYERMLAQADILEQMRRDMQQRAPQQRAAINQLFNDVPPHHPQWVAPQAEPAPAQMIPNPEWVNATHEPVFIGQHTAAAMSQNEVTESIAPVWERYEAIIMCRKIEEICPQFGCHVALTGGLIYKEGKRKDCDILFYRIRQVERIDLDGLWRALEAIRFYKLRGRDWCYKALYKNKPVDCFFPEGGSDGESNSDTHEERQNRVDAGNGGPAQPQGIIERQWTDFDGRPQAITQQEWDAIHGPNATPF